MTTYLITYGTDPSDRFAARAYPTRSVAQAAGGTLLTVANVDFATGAQRTTSRTFEAMAPVMKVAERWNPDAEDGRARFVGKNLRGVVMGLQ